MIDSGVIFATLLGIILGTVLEVLSLWKEESSIITWLVCIPCAMLMSALVSFGISIGVSYVFDGMMNESPTENVEDTVADVQAIYMFEDGTYFHYEKESDGSYICKYIVEDDKGKHVEKIDSSEVVFGENTTDPIARTHICNADTCLEETYIEFCVPDGCEVYE